MSAEIPKVIHQIWIGHLPPPNNLLQTWKEKNPEYEYILWDEARIARDLSYRVCHAQVDIVPEINGKADILRWEILYQYGGFFFDADSVCLKPLLDEFRHVPGNGFSCFENESMREGLVACGSMGFIPQHPLVGRILESIRNPENQTLLTTTRAWYSVGPGVLTRIYNETPIEEKITVFPSYMFLPRHHTGLTYTGHEQVYAYQFWGTNDRSYSLTDSQFVVPPEIAQQPARWVSVIVSSLDTPADYVFDCLQSIQRQTGYFGIELVWVNDGSTADNTATLKHYLRVFQETSRFIQIRYLENPENWGCRRSLRRAVEHCTHDLVFKMDADDMMLPSRMALQMRFMDEHPDAPVCGGQIEFFQDGQDNTRPPTHHHPQVHPQVIEWGAFVKAENKPGWFMNHPTLCFRKKDLLSVGSYQDTPLCKECPERNMMDDYELELRLLQRFGRLYNLPDTVLKYRIHPGQMTQQFPHDDEKMVALREEIIRQRLDTPSNNITIEISDPTPVAVAATVAKVVAETAAEAAIPKTPVGIKEPVKSEPEVMVPVSEPSFLATGVYTPTHFVYI